MDISNPPWEKCPVGQINKSLIDNMQIQIEILTDGLKCTQKTISENYKENTGYIMKMWATLSAGILFAIVLMLIKLF